MVAIALTALWTVTQTYGGLMIFQLSVIAGVATFAYSAFGQSWDMTVEPTEFEKFDKR